MSGSDTLAPPQAGFRHEALLYADEAEFLAATVPFVAEGVAGGEAVLVALRSAQSALLQDALGPRSTAVEFVDMTVLGTNPARILPAWRAFVDRATSRGLPLRGIGEPIWSGRSAAEIVECQRHEALLNVAFDGGPPWRLMCPYDVTALPREVIDEARRSHPVLHVDGEDRTSAEAMGTDMATVHLSAALSVPPEARAELAFGAEGARGVRDFVAAHVLASGLSSARGFDLVVAASEIATNSLRHGGGSGTVRAWYDATELVCEFSDAGALTDPLAGRERPSQDGEGQRGLWLANQLCDLVQIRVFDTGTVVRLHMTLDASRPQSAFDAY